MASSSEKRRMSVRTLGEILGYAGVIGSLIFVGREIQQNTLALQAAAIQESTSVVRTQVQMFATDPELNRINMVGREDPSRLSPEERARFTWGLISYWWGMQGLYRQWDLGVLPDEEWQAWYRVMCNYMEEPGHQEYWAGEVQFIPEFIEIVRSCDADRNAS